MTRTEKIAWVQTKVNDIFGTRSDCCKCVGKRHDSGPREVIKLKRLLQEVGVRPEQLEEMADAGTLPTENPRLFSISKDGGVISTCVSRTDLIGAISSLVPWD